MNQMQIWVLPVPGPQLISVGGHQRTVWNLFLQHKQLFAHCHRTDKTNTDVIITPGA